MTTKPIYIIDGARTPFLKAKGKPGPFMASDLATQAGRALLNRMPFAPTDLDEVILGAASPSADEVNIGRVVALRLGAGQQVPGWTVMRNCASGMQAIDSAIANMEAGRSNVVLAGGVDALSRAPLLFSETMVHWLANFYAAKTSGQKAAVLARFKLANLAPVIGIMKGLTDPNVGLIMGQTAENLAWRFGITRDQQDEFAVRSHQRLVKAQDAGTLSGNSTDRHAEVVPVFDDRGNLYALDDGVRRDSSVQGLAKLKPFFDKKYGTVTAGNSSQTSDGAAASVVMSEKRAHTLGLQPLARFVAYAYAGCLPEEMGLGPVYAIPKALKMAGMTLDQIDVIELNEAFAAQALGVIKALNLDPAKVNVNGGAIALGHPLGCTGAKLTATLLEELNRRKAKYGMVTMCVGGGMGAAGIFENLR